MDINDMRREENDKAREEAYDISRSDRPTMVGLWCRIGLHRWSAWHLVREGDIIRDKMLKGQFKDQEKICLRCLKIQARRDQVIT